MMFVSEECNLAAVPQFQKSRRATFISEDSVTLHTELPPARKRKGEDWRNDIVLVPIRVPLWFIGYLIVCGQLRLRDISFQDEMVRSVCEQELGLQQGLKGMRTIDVLSHMLGFEDFYPGLSTCQWRDISLDALEVVNYDDGNLGLLDRFIALNPAMLTIRLYLSSWTVLRGHDGHAERVTSERLQEMRVDAYYDFSPDECAVLLDYLVTAAPNIRSLSVRVGYWYKTIKCVQEAVEAVRDSSFPKLMCVMSKETVVEFEVLAGVRWVDFEEFRGSDHQLLRFGAPVQRERLFYSRSLAIARGEGLPDWHLSFHFDLL